MTKKMSVPQRSLTRMNSTFKLLLFPDDSKDVKFKFVFVSLFFKIFVFPIKDRSVKTFVSVFMSIYCIFV